MKAARLFAIGDMRCTEVDLPPPGPGEISLRVEAAGICGTDRHLFKGEFPSRPPVTLGHEFAGIVTAAGPGAGIAPGTRVACDPNIACGRCDACLRGRPNLCSANVAIGLSRDGGFAQAAVIPAHRAVVLAAGMTGEQGAFCEPLACTLHGIDIGAPLPGERVLVLGGGVIGQLAVQLCARAGAEVMLLTRGRGKLDTGLACGARHAATSPEAARAIWPGGADLVIECAGVAETVAAAPGLTASGGRIVLLGVLPRGERVPVEPFDLLFREIRLLPAFINPFTQARAAALIAGGVVDVAPLISRRIPLGAVPQTVAAPPLPEDIKVLVLPD